MKRALLASLIVAALGLSAQCLAACPACRDGSCPNCKPSLFHRATGWMHGKQCQSCGKHCGPFHKCCGLLHRRRTGDEVDYGAPPSAQITYPYYTIRGPRDFLDPNPRGIGP